jgi:hypothetical protein
MAMVSMCCISLGIELVDGWLAGKVMNFIISDIYKTLAAAGNLASIHLEVEYEVFHANAPR